MPTQHETRSTQRTTHNAHQATRNTHHATRNTQYATHITHHAFAELTPGACQMACRGGGGDGCANAVDVCNTQLASMCDAIVLNGDKVPSMRGVTQHTLSLSLSQTHGPPPLHTHTNGYTPPTHCTRGRRIHKLHSEFLLMLWCWCWCGGSGACGACGACGAATGYATSICHGCC
jgi:hypothetical protein